MRYIFVN
jgi:hypothetical protein